MQNGGARLDGIIPSLEQRCRFRLSARLLAPGRPAELLSMLLHDRGRRFEADAEPATLVDKGALGGNSSDDILGGQYRWHLAATPGGMFARNAMFGVKTCLDRNRAFVARYPRSISGVLPT